ncbi:hypothetical protein L9F63_012097 [Diploptera punctata]|uniref:Transcription factor TFIIIC triple barrel domain-containing protein n=1 Tax=Diploptera punctata TaxID=6984 RepID=A0AAD8AD49_DIPPU|nr:hypothetical protein L9F63_027748 [Diploptera punctata]KAJ9596841.1 hypothetical protein L9F63_012097 [Diploptera punctata]
MSSSEEEEELLIHVEFDGMLEKGVLEQRPVFFKMIGIEGSKPVMQIGNQTFTGEYSDIVGTSLFFEEDPAPAGGDPVFTKTPEHQLRYFCKTRKMLKMSRVFLKKKQSPEESIKNKSDLGDDMDSRQNSKEKWETSEEVTMEIDEDPVLKQQHLGKTSETVEKIVEEQIEHVTNEADSTDNT